MFSLTEALEAIKDKPEFNANKREFGTVIDYAVTFKETFAGKTSRETTILINLRGTCFNDSGEIIRLPYHKFHNLNENENYSADTFDFTQPHVIEKKIDGSMVSPIIFPDGHWELGTRAGVTDVSKLATAFLGRMNRVDSMKFRAYKLFIDECVKTQNIVPIFEYIGPDNPIVIEYIDTKLVLTGVRYSQTGEYVKHLKSWITQFGETKDNFNLIDLVPVVSTEHSTISELAAMIKDLHGEEGVVVKFEDGRMVKIKAAEYCLKHKALDGLRFEKDVLKLVLNNEMDDILPLVSDDMRTRLNKYRSSVQYSVQKHHALMMAEFAIAIEKSKTKAEFAGLVKQSKYKTGLFLMYEHRPFSLSNFALKNCGSSTDVEKIRWLIGPSFLEVV